MHVYLKNGMHWTEKLAADFVQEVIEDVEFDGLNSYVDYEFEGNLLSINCDFE